MLQLGSNVGMVRIWILLLLEIGKWGAYTPYTLAADPDEGGDVRTLNLPAVRDLGCDGSCSFTRTVRNTLGEASEWSAGGSSIEGGFNVEVTPSSFSFSGDINETRELTITIIPLEELTDEVVFGEVVLSEAGAQSPDLHITAAIIGADEPIGILHVSPAALADAAFVPPDAIFSDRFEQP